MSFLGRGGSINNNASGVNPEKIEMAITEFVSNSSVVSPCLISISRLDTVTDFFNRMVSLVVHSRLLCQNAKQTSRSCYAKCISQRFAEGDLNKGENVCIDRCVSKYNEVQKKIGEKLQARGAANAASAGSTFSAL